MIGNQFIIKIWHYSDSKVILKTKILVLVQAHYLMLSVKKAILNGKWIQK